MKLKAGQRYVRNDGLVILIEASGHAPKDRWQFVDKEHNNLYTEDGVHGDSLSDDWDIAGPYIPKEKR